MNDLVNFSDIQRLIDIEKDINILSKYHAALASKEFRKQIDGSIQAINKCEKYKIKIEMAFGDYYKRLESESGKRFDLVKSVDEVSSKQQAQGEIGKSRETINKYVKISDIQDRDGLLEKYEKTANEKRNEMSSDGFINFIKNNNHIHVKLNTGFNEWYTPPEYINDSKLVMGKIDLDPASSDEANSILEIDKYYTIDNDGLNKEWIGNIWMNPPYSQPDIALFCKKLSDEIKNGNCKQAIVLINNSTESKWFQDLAYVCSAICLHKGRIKYWKNGSKENLLSPLQGQIFLYFGNNKNKFKNIFSKHGIVFYA